MLYICFVIRIKLFLVILIGSMGGCFGVGCFCFGELFEFLFLDEFGNLDLCEGYNLILRVFGEWIFFIFMFFLLLFFFELYFLMKDLYWCLGSCFLGNGILDCLCFILFFLIEGCEGVSGGGYKDWIFLGKRLVNIFWFVVIVIFCFFL